MRASRSGPTLRGYDEPGPAKPDLSKFEYLTWIVLVTALLIGGFVMGQRFVASPEDAATAAPMEGESTFKDWFWESRSLDLAVQVGLIFVGALGITALLPRSEEDEGR